MHKLVNSLLSIYFWPLRLSTRLLLYAEGKIFKRDKHFIITSDVIRKHFGNDPGIIVDVGAYDGDSALFFSGMFPGKTIVGFEANPTTFSRAKQNIKSFPNIDIVNVALSSEPGEMDFFITDDAVSSSLFKPAENREFVQEKRIKVPATTLDQALSETEAILLLKLDVQGAELNILKGGQKTLLRTKLVLTEMLNAELYDGACRYYEVDEYLRAAGFQIFSIITSYNNEGTKYFDVLYINRALQS